MPVVYTLLYDYMNYYVDTIEPAKDAANNLENVKT